MGMDSRYIRETTIGLVGITTGYGLDGPGIEVRFFAHVQTDPGAHPVFCRMGIGSRRGHERVELYLFLPSGPVQACNGTALPFTIRLNKQWSAGI
jgi:hypothetical protein